MSSRMSRMFGAVLLAAIPAATFAGMQAGMQAGERILYDGREIVIGKAKPNRSTKQAKPAKRLSRHTSARVRRKHRKAA